LKPTLAESIPEIIAFFVKHSPHGHSEEEILDGFFLPRGSDL
jgi:hypothetical protein